MEAQKDILSPGQMLIESLYLLPGTQVRLVKVNGNKDSNITVGSVLEGVLDTNVKIGQPIYLDSGKKNTSKIVAVNKDGEKIFFKTETSIYELVPPSAVQTNTFKSEIATNLEKKIELMLDSAKDNALEEKDIGVLIARRHELGRQQKNSSVISELQHIDKKIKSCTVTVETISEFKILMEKIRRNYYTTIGTIAHENSHANKADSLGIKTQGYSVIVTKKNNIFQYQPVALSWDMDSGLSVEERIKANIAIANAPKEYGNKLSPGDEELVRALKKQLENL